MLDLCAEIITVFSLPPDGLGCCTIIAEAVFPLQSGTRPVDRALYRTSPLVQEAIDEQIEKSLEQDIIEERTINSAWGSLVTIFSKAD